MDAERERLLDLLWLLFEAYAADGAMDAQVIPVETALREYGRLGKEES